MASFEMRKRIYNIVFPISTSSLTLSSHPASNHVRKLPRLLWEQYPGHWCIAVSCVQRLHVMSVGMCVFMKVRDWHCISSCIELHFIYLYIYLFNWRGPGQSLLLELELSESDRMIDQPALGNLLSLFAQGSKSVLLCQPSDVELGDLKPSPYTCATNSLPINHLLNPCIWRI